MPDRFGDEEQQEEELNKACSAIGHELAKLSEFLKWAGSVVSKAETDRLSPQRRDEVGKCSARGHATFESPYCPERFYIGDGLVAQLLADAEAAARVG